MFYQQVVELDRWKRLLLEVGRIDAAGKRLISLIRGQKYTDQKWFNTQVSVTKCSSDPRAYLTINSVSGTMPLNEQKTGAAMYYQRQGKE